MQQSLGLLVLGPVEAVHHGDVVSLRGSVERTVLAALIIGIGHIVPDDALIAAVWGDDPPPSHHASLQSTISRLRNHLGEVIERREGGYRLTADPNVVDAVRFEAHVRAAEDGQTTHDVHTAARRALSLWRGSPYGELGDREPFRLERIRLEELRLQAVEHLLGAEVALGHLGTAVAALEAAVEEHPYRERLWYLLVTGLAREGRRVEAIRSCDRLRAILGDLGLLPSREFIDLEERVIAEAPDVASHIA